jgi:hypothetical protein
MSERQRVMPYDLHQGATPYERAAYILAADLDRWPGERAHTLSMTRRFVVEMPPFRDLIDLVLTAPENDPVGRVRVARGTLGDLIEHEDSAAYRPTDDDLREALHALQALLHPAWGVASTDEPARVPGAAWRLDPHVLHNVTGLTTEGLRAVLTLHVRDVDDAARLLYNGDTLRSRAELRFAPHKA